MLIVPLESISSVTSVSNSLFENEIPIANPLTSALAIFTVNAKNVANTVANNFFIFIIPFSISTSNTVYFNII